MSRPDASRAPADNFVFALHPDPHEWRSVGPTPESAPHITPNPLADHGFLRDLRLLRFTLQDAPGNPRQVDEQIAETRHLARSVGERLTAALLSPDARAALRERIAEADRGAACLTLRVAAAPLADAALALPWELLMPDEGRFAVEELGLDLVRDAVPPDAPELDLPSAALSVAVIVAAPDDQTALRHEDETYRLLKTLAPLGPMVHFAELGELDDFVTLVDRTGATVVHFSGHGEPGELVFEDALGLSRTVRVSELTARLRRRTRPSGTPNALPQLFFLAACHGASPHAGEASGADIADALGEGASTAASLHREGFACVVGYFGPVGDAVSTAAEVVFYAALSQGRTILQAARHARTQLAKLRTAAGQSLAEPLGWAQLAVYLRGPDRPLASAPRATPVPAAPPRLARETVEISGLPALEHGFIGRRALLHEVRRKLRSGRRLLVFHGLGGLGKTALACRLLSEVLAREPADRLILRPAAAVDIDRLRRQAEEHGRVHGLTDWEDHVRGLRERHPDPEDGLEQTVLALKRHRPDLALYADDVEALQVGPDDADPPGALGTWRPEARLWWSTVGSLSEHVLVLVSTRYRCDRLDPDAFVALDRMSHADVWRMLDTFPTLSQLPWQIREEVAEAVDGLPRAVERLDELLRGALDDGPARAVVDTWTASVAPELARLDALLADDLRLAPLWRCISSDARDHAVAASVLTRPAPRRILDTLGSAADELIAAGLLTRHRELARERLRGESRPAWTERWSMHAAVRRFLSIHGTLDDRRQARARAAGAYAAIAAERGAAGTDRLEAIELYLAADDARSAWPLAYEHLEWMHKRAQHLTAMDLLARFRGADLESDHRLEYTVQLAEFGDLVGHDDPSIESDLRDAIALAGTPDASSYALHTLAHVLKRQGKYEEAEQFLYRIIHPDAPGSRWGNVASVHDLAEVLLDQGKVAAAERLLRDFLTDHERTNQLAPLDDAELHHALSRVLTYQGNHVEAESAIRRALALKEATIGPEHPSHAASLYHLAHLLSRERGRRADAELLLRRCLAVRSRMLGPEHPASVSTLHHLVVTLIDDDRHSDAEPFARQYLELCQHLPDGVHLKARGLSLLATITLHQHRVAEAEALVRESLAITTQSSTYDRAEHVSDLRKLERILWRQDRFSEAEAVIRHALYLLAEAGGIDHPLYHVCLLDLARNLFSQGKTQEGLLVGADSNWQVESRRFDLAMNLAERGEFARAADVLRNLLSIQEWTHGVDHPEYFATQQALAQALSGQGNHAEAEALLRECLSVRGQPEQAQHDHVALLYALTSAVAHQGRFHEAEGLAREALALVEGAFGCENELYSQGLHALAGMLHQQKQYAEAEALLRSNLALTERLSGPANPEVGASMRNLACILARQEKYPEAEALYHEALAVLAGSSGCETREYCAYLNELGRILASQQKHDQAAGVYRDSLTLHERVYGHDSTKLCTILGNLAFLAGEQGRPGDGVPLAERALTIARANLGEGHGEVRNLQRLHRRLSRGPRHQPT